MELFPGQKTKDVTITAEGRDKGKIFRLYELHAYYAEKWARRALSLIGRGALEAKTEIEGGGMAAIWAMGLQALVQVEDNDAIDALLDEMLKQIQIREDMPAPAQPAFRDVHVIHDILEVGTFFTLRQEVLQLHINFSVLGALSPNTSENPLPGAMDPTSAPIPTSQTPSARSYRRGRRQ